MWKNLLNILHQQGTQFKRVLRLPVPCTSMIVNSNASAAVHAITLHALQVNDFKELEVTLTYEVSHLSTDLQSHVHLTH